MTCDGRTGQNVPSTRGVHPIQTRASWPVFPRTPAAKANRPEYATSERQAINRPCSTSSGEPEPAISPARHASTPKQVNKTNILKESDHSQPDDAPGTKSPTRSTTAVKTGGEPGARARSTAVDD